MATPKHLIAQDRDWWATFGARFGWRLIGFSGIERATFDTHHNKVLQLDREEARAILGEPR